MYCRLSINYMRGTLTIRLCSIKSSLPYVTQLINDSKPSFPYWKRWKAGRGLGTRLGICRNKFRGGPTVEMSHVILTVKLIYNLLHSNLQQRFLSVRSIQHDGFTWAGGEGVFSTMLKQYIRSKYITAVHLALNSQINAVRKSEKLPLTVETLSVS